VPGTVAAMRGGSDRSMLPRGRYRRARSSSCCDSGERPPVGPGLGASRSSTTASGCWLREGGRGHPSSAGRGEEITRAYPEIAAGLRALPVKRFLLDGEIVAEDESGRPSFQRLQARMHLTKRATLDAAMAAGAAVRGLFFDCLGLEATTFAGSRLAQRKELPARVVPPLGTVQRCDHVLEHGEAFFEAASEMGSRGFVAKRLASRYSVGRTPDWVKVKCGRRQEFVIGGYTEPQGSRARFGALHVGLYEGTRLV